MTSPTSQPERPVLLLAASVGAGHIRAAEALGRSIQAIEPDRPIKQLDAMTLTNRTFRWIYADSYMSLTKRFPPAVGLVYDLTDVPTSASGAWARTRMRVQHAMLPRLKAQLLAEPFAAVITTHFLPAEIAGTLRASGELRCPLITIVTDFDSHAIWATRDADAYFVAGSQAGDSLVSYGVPAERITVTGIPILPGFTAHNRAERAASKRAELGLSASPTGQSAGPPRPCIILLGGAVGGGPMEQLLAQLLAIPQPLDLIVVCGKNDELRTRIAVKPPGHHRVVALGYRTDMHDLLTCADLLISKPGGLTSSETLASGVPMAVISPIPGQEFRNSDYLLENGCGIKINNPGACARKIGSLLADRVRLQQMQANCLAIARPNAADTAARRIIEMIHASPDR